MNQGRSHCEVGHDHGITSVESSESVDVAFTSFNQADGGVVVSPSVGDGAF